MPKKVFMKLTTAGNVLKLFWYNLCCNWLFNFGSGYAARVVNYA
jgi:hypothetical protein